MAATLVLPQQIAQELLGAARLPVETAGVLLVSVFQTASGDTKLLARGMRWVHEESYTRREATALGITSDGYIQFLAEAEALGATPIWVHTHPGEDAWPTASEHDDEVDRQISALFRLRSGSCHYGTLIVSPRSNGFTFTGYIQAEDENRVNIERLLEVGDGIRLTPSFEGPINEIEPLFDRNIRAFGGAVQRALGGLRIGIVGCGGTGSAVAEQLVRLGVRQIHLFDPDRLSESNLTRVYGSLPEHVGQFKVDVLAQHLGHVAPGTSCTTTKSMITIEPTARILSSCDVIFGCTDDNAGRLVLSRLSTYFLTPVIDCGVLLTSDGVGSLLGIDGRVTTLLPGQACLVCRGRINLARAASELMTPDERRRREDEGYAPALGGTEPAVVTFTTLVGATAVSELLERLIGYGPKPAPSEILLRCHEREVSTSICSPRPGHYCDPSAGKIGLGVTTPFLEQTWTS